ncbi:HAD-IB family hydrolase [Candidatus Sumerlaeota bacterium]|nr:HAD-IB family hydrolase [Candidatus Sumerlaeota bacterium]
MTFRPDVVFFDMDHTLIDNDCDVSWKEYLIQEGLADPSERGEMDRYWRLYYEGNLPVQDYLSFQLAQFRGRAPEEMAELARRHFEWRVRERVFPEARATLERLEADGVPRVMLTATNRPVAEPLARHLDMTDLIATELEIANGRYTGRIVEPYCIAEGKFVLASRYAAEQGRDLNRSVYYGDSIPDVAMLERVGRAVAVNPGEEMERIARSRGWRIERWSPRTEA